MSADNLHVVKWWVDASYKTHDNMRRHIGKTMSMVPVLSMSKKKKTEHEELH